MTIDTPSIEHNGNCCSYADTTRVPDLWFEDGGLIIQAGSSLFRVSRGVLAARSDVFKHTFESCPLPSATEDARKEMMDGVPFLRLQDDANDMEHFLRAIFDSSYFEPYPGQTSLAAIAGALRLGHKYDVGYLRQRALDHLYPFFPRTLSLWDSPGRRAHGPEGGSGLLHAFVAVQLALEVDAPWLLPAAVYQCCTYPIEDILDLDVALSSEGLGPASNFCSAQKLCLSARPKILASYHTLSGHLRTTSCARWPSCLARLDDVATAYAHLARTGYDPLGSLNTEYWASLRNVCANCLKESKVFYAGWRSDLWSELPKMIDLKDWGALNSMVPP